MPNPIVNRLLRIPRYPSYLDLNFATIANGPVPGMIGATWDVASGVARNNIALGSELITNGTMELDASWPNLGTPTTNERSNAQAHGGTYSRHTVASAANTGASQALTNAAGYHLLSAWIWAVAGGSNAARFASSNFYDYSATGAAWANYVATGRLNATHTLRLKGGAATQEAYFDDVSTKAITMSSAFSVRRFGSIYGSLKAAWTMTAKTYCQTGVVMCANYPSMTNFVIVYQDGGTIVMDKCVNGTYTNLILTTTAYGAGKNVMIKRIKGTNTFQAWYGTAGSEAQVGTDQTITDVSIISNTYHGLFDTSPQLNTCSRFIYSAAG